MLCYIFIAYPLSTQALLTYKVLLCILTYRTINVFFFFCKWDFAVVRSRPNLLIGTVRNQNDNHSMLMKSTLYSCGLCGLLPDYQLHLHTTQS